MVHRATLIFLFLILSQLSFSQQIQKGDIVKDRQFLMDNKELTANDAIGNFISIRPHYINGTLRDYYLEFFENLNFLERIKIETENETEILSVFILNKKAYVFIKERKNQSISLRLDIVDLKTKLLSKKTLIKTNKDTDKPLFKALRDNYFIELDYYSENLVLKFPVIEEKLTFAFVKIFNKEIEEISQINIYADKTLSYQNVSFLNVKYLNNKVYALFQLNDKSADNKKFYRLIEHSQSQEQFIDIIIPSDSYELINSEVKNNYMIIAGLYSHFKKGGYKGFTYYKINLESLELEAQKQSEFNNEKTKNYFSGLFTGNRSVDINNIFIDDEYNTYIAGQFYILQKQTTPIGIPIASFALGGVSGFVTLNPFSSSVKLYDDILISKIDENGNLSWDNRLQLRATEKIKSIKRDSSTFIFFANNQINILMNGFIDPDKDGIVMKQNKRRSKTNFYNITLNSHGEVFPNILFPNADSEILFKSENSVKHDGLIHILGQGNMRKQLLKLDFN